MELGGEKIREIDLFDVTSFFGLDFLKFSDILCDVSARFFDSDSL